LIFLEAEPNFKDVVMME